MKVKNQINVVIVLTMLAFLVATFFLVYGYYVGTPIEDMSNWADISMAVSSIFVLVIGIISITLVASVETADYRNAEKVKEDMMRLTAALFSISHKRHLTNVFPASISSFTSASHLLHPHSFL